MRLRTAVKQRSGIAALALQRHRSAGGPKAPFGPVVGAKERCEPIVGAGTGFPLRANASRVLLDAVVGKSDHGGMGEAWEGRFAKQLAWTGG